MARITLVQMLLLVAAAAVLCGIVASRRKCYDGCTPALGEARHLGYVTGNNIPIYELVRICPRCGHVLLKQIIHVDYPREHGIRYRRLNWRDRMLHDLSPD